MLKKTKRAPKVEVGTGTTDGSLDEWLQVCSFRTQIILLYFFISFFSSLVCCFLSFLVMARGDNGISCLLLGVQESVFDYL